MKRKPVKTRWTEQYNKLKKTLLAAKKEEIAENGYALTPGRYVDVAEEEDDGIPFAEKIKKLSGELKDYFDEGRELEKEIENNLKNIKI